MLVKIKVKLKKEDELKINKILSSGTQKVRVIKRSRTLQLFNEGKSSPTVGRYVGITPETARRIANNYNNGDLNTALYEKSRPGNARALNQKQASQIIALACTDPPVGYSKWSIELLTTEVKRKKIVKKVGRETIRVLLKSHDLKPWREKNVVCADIDVRIYKQNGKYTRFIQQKLQYK
jgi:putative transposase